MFAMSTNFRFFLTLCGIFSIFENGCCYKYQYNPISRECELMLSLPGRPAHVSLGIHKTDTRYSQDYGGVGNSYGHIPSSSHNKVHSNANSKYNSHLSENIHSANVNSQYGAYDPDIDTRPSVSSAASHLSNNYHSKTQSEIEQQLQRDREIEKEVLRELEIEKEKERLKEIEKDREIEKRLRDREIERELLKEKEREAQLYEATYEQSKASSSSNYNSGSDRYPSSSPIGPYDDVYPSTSTGIKDSSSYASLDSSSGYASSSSALGSSGVSSVAKSTDYIYNEGVLAAHNNLRAKHGVNPLTLDDALMYSAQQHATRLARLGSSYYEQSLNAKSGKYGESIAVRHGSLSPYEVTNIWYKENRNYDYIYPQLVYTPSKNSNVHFTALVWKSTSKIGVGKATDINGKTYVVANYWPPGNYEGLLTENVFAPLY